MKKGKLLALLVDGADLLQDAQGRVVSDWIPQNLPQVRAERGILFGFNIAEWTHDEPIRTHSVLAHLQYMHSVSNYIFP